MSEPFIPPSPEVLTCELVEHERHCGPLTLRPCRHDLCDGARCERCGVRFVWWAGGEWCACLEGQLRHRYQWNDRPWYLQC